MVILRVKEFYVGLSFTGSVANVKRGGRRR